MTTIVLFGGSSDERQVSVATAQNVARAIRSPLCWFEASEGAIHDVPPAELLTHQRPFEDAFDPKRPAVWPDLEQALDTLPVEDPVFLLAYHGGAGEDGTVQRIMERRGIPFTGSGSEASAAAFDKARAKEIVKGRVRVAESRVVREPDEKAIGRAIAEMRERHARLVLKPLAAGSSRGLFFLGRGDDAVAVARQVASRRMPYLVEQLIGGRELTVGVADLGEGPIALPVIEIEVESGHTFDYDGKYLGKGTREICPANIPEETALAAQKTALEAHRALGAAGYSRTDIMAGEDGMYFLELNTLPGLTTSSLVPQELRAAGIEFGDFLNTQVELARRRARANRAPARASR